MALSSRSRKAPRLRRLWDNSRHIVAAAIAYCSALLFVFPHHFSLAAHHADMYRRFTGPFLRIFLSPRPLSVLLLFPFTYLRFEYLLISYALIWLVNGVLLVSILEKYHLRRRIGIAASYLTFFIAFSAPGFYASHTYDVPTALAMLLGLLAIIALEHRPFGYLNATLTCLLAIASGLAKESFLPVLTIYALARIAQNRRLSFEAIVSLLAPIVAGVVSVADAKLTKSQFLSFGPAEIADAYKLNMSLSSVLRTLGHYLHAAVPSLAIPVICIWLIAIWLKGRIALAGGIIAAALSAYLPYAMLPSHVFGYYTWVGMPFLALLIPLSLTPKDRNTAKNHAFRDRLVGVVTIVATISLAPVYVRADYADSDWLLRQEEINRNLLDGFRKIAPQLRASTAPLFLGVNYTFHPWQHPEFLRNEFAIRGPMYLAVESRGEAFPRPVSAVATETLSWSQYDVVVVFGSAGRLIADYRGQDIAEFATMLPLNQHELAALLTRPDLFQLAKHHTTLNDWSISDAVTIGRAFMQWHRYTGARYFLAKAVAQNPNDAYADFSFGECLEAWNDRDEASLYYHRAVELSHGATNPYFIEALHRVDDAPERSP